MDPGTLPPSTIGTDRPGAARVPGLVVVFTRNSPSARVMPLDGATIELGRGDDGPNKLDDGRVSRRHVVVDFDGQRFTATDLGSQNGSFVDGQSIAANTPTVLQRVLRAGDSLLVPRDDVGPYLKLGVRTIDGFVRGPAMQALLEEVARAASSGPVLHVRGESGTGKEGVAAAFHRAGPRASGPLVAVNCAAIPPALAERLLFGAKRGAYSGADHDATGYLQDADGGTLFLDEVAELDAQVQAKLLRALESKEVLQLGASKPRRVDLAFCSATNKDLRALVGAGTLRDDLYYRIGRPMVLLPALRNRPEEIVALIASELAKLPAMPVAHVSLVEQCLLRAWPGNVRELIAELRTAAQAITADDGNRVLARHLSPSAGSVFASPSTSAELPGTTPLDAAEPARRRAPPVVDDGWRQRIEDALRANAGNVAAAARALGLHRTQLRRLIARSEAERSIAPSEAERSTERMAADTADDGE